MTLRLRLTALLLATGVSLSAQAGDFDQRPGYDAFRAKALAQGLSADALDSAMRDARYLPRIIEIMNRPGESKPWYAYQDQFMQPYTIDKGAAFARQYADVLRRAEQEYGVPRNIILGILGVETGYGRNRGSFRSLDALATLGFGHARRADYFQNELIALIKLGRQQGMDPISYKSSYAGALGWPQFMPSNVNKFGVDYDRNGRVDLIDSPIDAIGSIANYLNKHGWQRGQGIAYPATFTGTDDSLVVAKDISIPTTAGQLMRNGLRSNVPVPASQSANGIRLEGENGMEYWLTLPNFQVITTYNKSRMYAMAVWQLGDAVVANAY